MRARIRRAAEWLGLAAAAHYLLYLMLTGSTSGLTFDSTYRTVTWTALVCLGFIRLGTGLLDEYTQAADKKEQIRILLKGLTAAGAIVPCAILAKSFGYTELVYLPFCAFCLYGTEARKALKVYTLCVGAAMTAIVLCSLTGAIPNLVFFDGPREELRIRGSYGGIYPTGTASHVVFLLLAAWCLTKRNGRAETALFSGLALAAAWICYTYPRSRTATITCLLIPAVILYDRLNGRVLSRRKGTRWIIRAVDGLTVGAFPIFATASAGAAWFYGSGSELGARLNVLLSDRLNQVWTSFQKYGIHAFGALTPQSGWGGNLVKVNEYEFLDSSYMLLLIRYGWVLFLIAMLVWMWMTRKAIRTGHRKIALAMAVIAFHSFSEHRFPELHYNILLAMPLCAYPVKDDAAETAPAEGKSRAAGWIVGGVMAAGTALLLPRALGWARCLIAVKGLTAENGKSLIPLLAGFAVFGFVTALWFALRRILADVLGGKKPCRRALTGLAALVLLAAGGIIRANGSIERAAEESTEQIRADTAAAEMILSAAEQPVYADRKEEIYKRAFSGISDRIFSPEELARNKSGSILADHDRECYQLTRLGAMYTEISPYTGLFTYDDAVIEQLTAAGYTFHPYYSAEREEKLADYAAKNKLEKTPDGKGLKVKGEKHFLFAGPYLEQFWGNYVVTYTLRVPDTAALKNRKREICELRVAALYGKDVRASRPVTAGEFSKDGTLTVELPYFVEDTRGVEFKVFGREDIEVWVERITWRRQEAD